MAEEADEVGGNQPLEVLRKYVYANLGQGKAGGLGQIYFLKFLRDRPDDFIASLTVANIIKRGNVHWELICQCHNGINIRISRNHNSDTFQVGADMGAPQPIIAQSAPMGILTGQALLAHFTAVHNAAPRYESADCTVFATRVMAAASGVVQLDDGDDDLGW